jgi:hypothetical protein
MREIKFRVPMKCQNGHFNFYYYSIRFGNMLSRFGEPSCKCPKSEFNEGYSPCGDDEQFTGLLDKNGKEIYEGDILRSYRFDVDVVEWSDYPGAWSIQSGEDWGMIPCHHTEVIGNIYANPSLLNSEGKP